MKQKRNRKADAFNDELEQFTLNLDDASGMTTVSPKKAKKKDSSDSLWYYIGFASDFGFTIAVPLAGGAFLGYFLDTKWSSYPKATLLFLFLGLVVSTTGLIKTIKELTARKN